MTTELQKHTVHAIVNIFETGRVLGDYGKVTLLPGDSGHLTYGRSQTTLASGNLFLLIKAYCDTPEAALAARLSPFLDRLKDQDLTLDHDQSFRQLLTQAGDDPVMQTVQDAFFDRVYWAPAVKSAAFIGSTTALGMATVYDSRIHGSWHRLRDQTIATHGSLADLGEESWIPLYIQTRHDWLANHSNRLLRKTVYRMEALKGLCEAGNWDLTLPITLRGQIIDESTLAGEPIRVSAEVTEERILRLRNPMMRGGDVTALQNALRQAGLALDNDGVFGSGTQAAVIQYQRGQGLTADGIVGPATRAQLGLDS
ncbi:chitosanase [Rhodovibrionaceae bacterium A322]